MFDDVKNKKQDNTIPSGPPSAQPKQAPPHGAGARQAEDIFADTDQPAKPEVFQPKAKEAINSSAGGKESKIAPINIGEAKKYIVIAAVVLGIVLVAYAGYWAYGKYFKATILVDEKTSAETKEQPIDNQAATPESAEAKKQEIAHTPAPPIDSDQDGLTDEEEKQLGTNPNSVDSDDDGLFDREEVKVYQTDPLNADTDGDGFLDGDEVRDGYNPKGTGRLFKIK